MKKEYDIETRDVGVENVFKDIQYYSVEDDDLSGTSTGEIIPSKQWLSPLPYDLDIFDVVTDQRVLARPRIGKFFMQMKNAIQRKEQELVNIHFNKLSLEESDKTDEVMVDWIYYYFRAFFSFDDTQGDMYGLILNNTQDLEFWSEFKPLIETDYASIAEKTIDFVLENIRR